MEQEAASLSSAAPWAGPTAPEHFSPMHQGDLHGCSVPRFSHLRNKSAPLPCPAPSRAGLCPLSRQRELASKMTYLPLPVVEWTSQAREGHSPGQVSSSSAPLQSPGGAGPCTPCAVRVIDII